MRYAWSLRLCRVVVLVLLALLLPRATTAAPAAAQAVPPAYLAGEVIIGWQPGAGPVPQIARVPNRMGADRDDPSWQAAAATISRATALPVLNARPEHGHARLGVRPGREMAEIERLQALPWVRYAELNHYMYAADPQTDAALYPDDPDFPRQWNMHRIKAAEAWALTRGSLSFVVAVLDTGVAQGHPEFAGRLESGFNYVLNLPGAEDDDPGSHGTHVTGILAANMNNQQGISGLAPDVKILPLKVLDSNRIGRYDAIASAIYDAADRRAQVINMSVAGVAPSQLLQDAVAYAQARGVLIVAAAGNCAQDPSSCQGQINPVIYPAAYPGVLAVSASDRFDRATIYSGYKSYIALAAPGGTVDEPVWSTVRFGYGPMYGTSMSTPHVSAAAALVWTLRPALTANGVTQILRTTADKVGSDPYSGQPLSYLGGRNDYFGSGRLNAGNAVRWAFPPSIAAARDHVVLLLGGARTSATRSVEITNPSGQHVYWQASVLAGAPWLTLSTPAGTSTHGYPAPLTMRADRLGLAPGVYYGRVRVQPIVPAGLPPIDLQVELRVTATLARTYAPLVMQGHGRAWLDPDAPGSLYRNVISPANDTLVTVVLPFSVSFYGVSYQLLQVSDNGFVTLGPAGGISGRAPTDCPGNARPPNNALYVLAHDWNPSLGGQITVHQPDPDTYVVTWRDVRRSDGPMAQSFQLMMGRAGAFQANYRTVESPHAGIIGAENFDATFAQQVYCNGFGRQVKSGESVVFTTRLPW